MSDTALLWFRLDLRLSDNPALLAALRHGGPVIPVFIWAPEEEGRWQPGAASRWWLHQSLTQLDASLRQRGSRLIVREGPTLETLRGLLDETGATAVFWNRRYEPAIAARDRNRVKVSLQKDGQSVEELQWLTTLRALDAANSTRMNPTRSSRRSGKPAWQARSRHSRARAVAHQPVPNAGRPPSTWLSSAWSRQLIGPPVFVPSWRPGEAGAAGRAGSIPGGGSGRLPDGKEPSRPRGHFAAFAPPPFRGNQCPADLARCADSDRPQGHPIGGAILPAANSAGASLPIISCSTSHTRPSSRSGRISATFPGNSTPKSACLAARADRLSHRGRRHARAVADGLDAQSRAHDRGVVPGQRLADSLAGMGRPGSGTRWSMPTWRTTPWAGSGRPVAVPMPPRISASSTR